MKKYKNIIWDWNGTLFDDIELCKNIINNVLKKRNMPILTTESYREIFTIPVEEYYKKAGFDFSKEPFEKVGKEWMEEYEQRKYEADLSHGAFETVVALHAQGISQSILSAYKQNTLNEITAKFGLTQYMSNIVGLDHIYATGKVDLGKELMLKLEGGKKDSLLIGDTLHDCEVAKEIGAESVLISSGHQSKERLQQCGVKVFDNFDVLKEYLLN